MRTWTLIAALALVPFCCGIAASRADIPPGQDDLLEDRGVFLPNWFAELQDVELQGDRAYVFGVGGLAIFDITDIDNPVVLGRYEPAGHPYNRYYRGAVDGNLACGGAREDLLAIIDVSNPALPVQVALHGVPGHSYEGAAMRNNLIYACRHANGLEIVDVSIPSLPLRRGQVPDLVNAWDVVLDGSYAYVADGAGGLGVVDVSDPDAPFLVARVATAGSANDVALGSGVLVVSEGSAGIEVFDLADPASPRLRGSADTSGLAVTVAMEDDLVHVADWDDVETFSVFNPDQPVAIGGEDTPIRAMGLDARPGLVAVADWSRLRLYRTGPTTRGDIQISVEKINLGAVPVGAVLDTSFTISNTGGGVLNVSQVQEYGAAFSILDPGPFTLAPGQAQTIRLRYSPAVSGYDATFISVTSDDTDEPSPSFPVTADDNPSVLDVGDPAPDFNLRDLDGVNHSLGGQRGRVVVMAFFANW